MGLSSEEVAAKMVELQKRVMAQSQTFEAEQAEIKRLSVEEDALLVKLREVQSKRIGEEQRVSAKKREIQELKAMMRELQHEMTKAQVEEASKVKQREDAAKYERIIAGAKWREFLYEHQMFGAKFGANARRWICGDTVGLGKTVQAVAWTDLVESKKILILTPKNLTQNFIDHIQEWSNGRQIIPIVGLPRDKRDLMLPIFRETMKEYVVVVNYEAWFQDRSILELLMHMQFDTIICDEAHKLKNPKSASFLGVNKLTYDPNTCLACGHYDLVAFRNVDDIRRVECENCRAEFGAFESGLRSVKNILLMTGTAVKNKPQDIFPLLQLTNGAAFGSEKEFLRTYCRQTESGRWTWRAGGEDALTRAISPFYLKRKRSDTDIKVPPQKHVRHIVQLDPDIYPEQYAAYKTLRTLSKVVIDNTEENENKAMAANAMITYLLRLRQMVSLPSGIVYKHPKTKEVLFECKVKESVKIDKAVELIEELVDNGSRVLVFLRFTPPVDALVARLDFLGINACVLDGRTKDADRKAIARNFDAKYVDEDGGPKWDVAICNYNVGSEGLTMTDATDTVIIDLPWNPAEKEQVTGRTDRIGQKRETTIHEIFCDVWIDQWMEELNEHKRKVTEGFEESMEFVQLVRDGLMSSDF